MKKLTFLYLSLGASREQAVKPTIINAMESALKPAIATYDDYWAGVTSRNDDRTNVRRFFANDCYFIPDNYYGCYIYSAVPL